jgi:hypothetical protein
MGQRNRTVLGKSALVRDSQIVIVWSASDIYLQVNLKIIEQSATNWFNPRFKDRTGQRTYSFLGNPPPKDFN